MPNFKTLPPVGFLVILIIGILFVLAVALLFYVYSRYKGLTARINGKGEEARGFKGALLRAYTAAYKKYGTDVNTPAIISDTISTRLSGLLLSERFLNNAVSLFVTLGLFGTFLGLSMSVSSLTKLIGASADSEWTTLLNDVGGGLMSALSGMGVAFYTSLFGVGCSIVLTILRTIFNPSTERERMETHAELWLDNEVAPGLSTEAVRDERYMLRDMISTLSTGVEEFKTALGSAATSYSASTRASAASLAKTIETSRVAVAEFNKVVNTFNSGVHDFSEVDYNLRGSVERMDLAVRDLSSALREINRRLGSASGRPSDGASGGGESA